MAYVLPGVEIIQDYENPGSIPVQGKRNHIVVGKLYQVVKKLAFPEMEIKSGDTVAAPMIPIDRVNLRPGAAPYEIAVGFVNAEVKVFTEVLSLQIEETKPSLVQGSYKVALRKTLPAHTLDAIRPGSILEHGSMRYVVKDRRGFDVTLARPITITSKIGESYSVINKHDYLETQLYTDDLEFPIRVATDLPIPMVGSLSAGIPCISYRAARTDMAGVRTFYRPSDVDDAMDTEPENPLGFGLMIAFAANGGAVPVKALALDPYLDEVEGYANAFNELRSRKDVYYVSVCTDNPTVQTMLSQHIASMNLPEIGYWRSAFVSSKLQDEAFVEASLPVSNP